MAPLSLFAEVVRLVLASEVDVLLAIPESAVEDFAAEATRIAADHLPGLAQRLEADMVLAVAERRALAAVVAEHVALRFVGTGGGGG